VRSDELITTPAPPDLPRLLRDRPMCRVHHDLKQYPRGVFIDGHAFGDRAARFGRTIVACSMCGTWFGFVPAGTLKGSELDALGVLRSQHVDAAPR
jgi:hypothetical protein